MFKLFKLNDDLFYVLWSTKKHYEGTQTQVIKRLLLDGVLGDEIAIALEALLEDDVAEFGINKRFIFSTKISTKAS